MLLVEDHADVAEVAEQALVAGGYEVLSCPDAAEALDVLGSDTQVDLLFTDLVLPGLGGRELAARAGALRPGLPVLYTSGHSVDGRGMPGGEDPTRAFIQKPYSVSELLGRVAEVLGG